MLKISEFGDPVLRQKATILSQEEIISPKTQALATNMQDLLLTKKLGVGLAAPQIGISKAMFIIAVRPTKHRPKVKEFDLVAVNPEIVETFGRRKQFYEGCISGGLGKTGLFAKIPRYKKLRLGYQDLQGKKHLKTFDGLIAHIIQHEIDHLNGVLFVDRVKDTKSYLTYKEYLKLAQAKAKQDKR